MLLIFKSFGATWGEATYQSSQLRPYEKMIYSESSWKIEHFLFLWHVLNRYSFRDNCVWNFEFVYKLFVVIHKLFWIFCRKINFWIDFFNFHNMNIVTVFIAKWDEQNDTKMIQFEHCFGLLKRKPWFQIQNFKRNYLENYDDSEHAIKTKNAPFFMIFPNISFFHLIVNYWTDLLRDQPLCRD